jgi:Ca2+-binding RTX toxin-like protein
MTVFFEDTDNVVAGTAVTMQSNDFLFVKAGVTVGSTGGAQAVLMNDGGTISTINGELVAFAGAGMVSNNGNHSITVGVGGSITARTNAIELSSDNNTIVNHGTIDGASGILCEDDGFGGNHILNTGFLTARANLAISLTGDGNFISNSGTISALNFTAIQFASDAGGDAETVETSGAIIANANPAIVGGDAETIVLNSGRIIGDVLLGVGNDTYDGESGRIAGIVDGGSGDDTLTGGGARDVLMGGGGSDRLEGGGGRDVFRYEAAGQSGGALRDTILGFDARKDAFDLNVAVSGIDATVNGGRLRAGNFTADLRDAIGAAQLDAGHAVVFKPTTGDLAGHTFLIVDANGSAGYQTNNDFVIDLADADNLSALDLGDFI